MHAAFDDGSSLKGSLSRSGGTVVALCRPRQYRDLCVARAACTVARGEDSVASKDKGGGKTSKKPAQHDLKAKRKAKKEKRAAK